MTTALTTNTGQQRSSQEDGSDRVVTSANGNAAYHLAQLDGSRLAIHIVVKKVKIFTKRQDEGPDLHHLNDEDNRTEPTNLSYMNGDVEESD